MFSRLLISLLLLCSLLSAPCCLGFPASDTSLGEAHSTITKSAIFQWFDLTFGCDSACASDPQQVSVSEVEGLGDKAGQVDYVYPLNAAYHFDSEQFVQSIDVVMTHRNKVASIIDEAPSGSFLSQGTFGWLWGWLGWLDPQLELARMQLALMLHPTQDFYAHSNWVELGINQSASFNLTEMPHLCAWNETACVGKEIINGTWRGVASNSCLTSGWAMRTLQRVPGRCTHGLTGSSGLSKEVEDLFLLWPEWGINKDTHLHDTGIHWELHAEAARLAVAHSVRMFGDIVSEALQPANNKHSLSEQALRLRLGWLLGYRRSRPE